MTITSRVNVSGEVCIILCDGAKLTVQQGITVNSGNSLTIYGQSGGSGSLTADAANYTKSAGIGAGCSGNDNGNLILKIGAAVYGCEDAQSAGLIPTSNGGSYSGDRKKYMRVQGPVTYVVRSWNDTDKTVEETPKTLNGNEYIPVTASTTSWGAGDPVSREQLVVMRWRQAGCPSGTGDLSAFRDADKLSSWAREAMAWAVGVGLIRGDDTGALNPGGEARRCEVAQILMNDDKREG